MLNSQKFFKYIPFSKKIFTSYNFGKSLSGQRIGLTLGLASAIALSHHSVTLAQTAITGLTGGYESGSESNYSTTTANPCGNPPYGNPCGKPIDMEFGVGATNDYRVTGFRAATGNYSLVNLADAVKFRRINNANVTGERQLMLFERDTSDATGARIRSSYADSMEVGLLSDVANRGIDNAFANNGNNNQVAVNNLERIDYIINSGLDVPTAVRNDIGFLILERGGNDPFKIAAITSLDANGNPASFAPLRSVANTTWGRNGPTIQTSVMRREENETNFRPSHTVGNQTISGIYISLSDLNIPAGQTVYGYALFPSDIPANASSNNLVNLTGFPTNTSDASGQGGLDLMAGGGIYLADSLHTVSGTLYEDTNSDNSFNNGEATLPNGINVILYRDTNSNGEYDSGVDERVQTNSTARGNGGYNFIGVADGTYRVFVDTNDPDLPSNLVLGTPNNTEVVVSGSDQTNINFGFDPPFDYGDAPDTYGDASHRITASPTTYLGRIKPPDSEADTQLGSDAGAAAEGDDNDGNDDDDAFTSLPNVPATGNYSLDVPVTNTSGGNATLHGWIDFNKNGKFESGEYQSAVVSNTSPVNLTWAVPADTNPGDTYARFRLTNDTLSDNGSTDNIDERSIGNANNGEVEDYQVAIAPSNNTPPVISCPANFDLVSFNWSPDNDSQNGLVWSDSTTNSYNINGNLMTATLNERGSTSSLANGSTFSGAFPPPGSGLTWLMNTPDNTNTQNASFTITFASPVPVSQFVIADIDASNSNNPTTWHDQVKVSASNSGNPLPVLLTPDDSSIITVTASGDTAFTADGVGQTRNDLPDANLTTTINGFIDTITIEYQDGPRSQSDPGRHGIGVGSFVACYPRLDLGDAPDTDPGTGEGNYQTLTTDDGASHQIVSGIQLGATVDSDDGSLQNSDATADDADDTDNDDDGVTLAGNNLQSQSLTEGDSITLDIATQGSGVLNAWIDWNNDGDFLDDDEQIATNAAEGGAGDSDNNVAGIQLNVNVPNNATEGNTFARFRYSTDTDLIPTGTANDGEVEDYQIAIASATSSGNGGVCTADYGLVYSGQNNQIFAVHVESGASLQLTNNSRAIANGLSTDHVNRQVYYGEGNSLYAWSPLTNTHVLVDNNFSSYISPPPPNGFSISSGGAAFYNGSVYQGSDTGTFEIFKVDFVPGSNGLSIESVTPIGIDDLVQNGTLTGSPNWGDFIIDDNGVITANGNGGEGYWSYDLNDNTFNDLNENFNTNSQLAKDGQGRLWALGDGDIFQVQVSGNSLIEVPNTRKDTTDHSSFDAAECVRGASSIGDFIWNDINGDGVQDSDEEGIENVTVDLIWDLDGNGVIDANEPVLGTRTTDANGNYDFDELIFGNYIIDVTDTNSILSDSTLTTSTSTFAVNLAVGAIDFNNADFGYELLPLNPNLLLVKRITAINPGSSDEVQFNSFVNDDSNNDGDFDNDPDNDPNWPTDDNIYLRGATTVADIQPGDEVEYTIYFLSNGDEDATNVKICDVIPDNMSFVSNSYDGNSGIALLNSSASGATPTNLSNAEDSDEGRFYAPGAALPVVGDPPTNLCQKVDSTGNIISVGAAENINGAIVVEIDSLPEVTAPGTPDNSYGFIRFRAQIK